MKVASSKLDQFCVVGESLLVTNWCQSSRIREFPKDRKQQRIDLRPDALYVNSGPWLYQFFNIIQQKLQRHQQFPVPGMWSKTCQIGPRLEFRQIDSRKIVSLPVFNWRDMNCGRERCMQVNRMGCKSDKPDRVSESLTINAWEKTCNITKREYGKTRISHQSRNWAR